jgi:hypothetical protein
MKLSELIEKLERDLERFGDLEVVVEVESPFRNSMSLSTVENTIFKKEWHKGQNAIMLDWRC